MSSKGPEAQCPLFDILSSDSDGYYVGLPMELVTL